MDDIYPDSSGLRPRTLMLNILTGLVLVSTLCVAGVYAALLINPFLSFNPYPPPTAVATLGLPSATPTPEITLPPIWTATITNTPGPSATPTMTRTPTASPSPTVDLTQEAQDAEGPAFVVSEGNPVFIPNIANNKECAWMGVGGQVFDEEGAPIINLSIHLEGTLGGGFITLDTLTGSATNLGPAGYVFDLADAPVASEGDIWIQLNDTAGIPLSDQVFLDTSAECSENFVLVNWRQNR